MVYTYLKPKRLQRCHKEKKSVKKKNVISKTDLCIVNCTIGVEMIFTIIVIMIIHLDFKLFSKMKEFIALACSTSRDVGEKYLLHMHCDDTVLRSIGWLITASLN